MTRLRVWRTRSALLSLMVVVGVLVADASGVATVNAAPAPPAPLPPVSTPPPPSTSTSTSTTMPPPPSTPIAAPSLPALPPSAAGSPGALGQPGEGAFGAEAAPIVAPEQAATPPAVVTADVARAESDHDSVVGSFGIEVRPVVTTLPVFARRASTGCPLAPPARSPSAGPPTTTASDAYGCPPVSVSMLGVRYWMTRNLALNGGLAFALGGGSQGDRLLDSYFGIGPGIGLSLMLGNWRHVTVAASPGLSFVWFKAAGSAAATYVADLRGEVEGEVHLGSIGLPALSLGIRSGVLLRLQKSAELSLWSAEVTGATTLRGLVSDVTLRYYF